MKTVRSSLLSCAVLAVVAAGCADNPTYFNPESPVLEVNAGGGAAAAMATIPLPIRLETQDEEDERTERTTSLGLPEGSIPYVKLADMTISVEWTLRNLDDAPGIARVDMNGANEWFRFVPELFDLDEDEEDVQPPPPLVDGAPLQIGPNETRSGVIREDNVREAAIDLELMSRAGMDVIVALLNVNEDTEVFTDTVSGAEITEDLFAGLVEVDMRFSATTHMVLEYSIRIRDHRGLLHDDLGAANAAELAVFDIVDLAPPAPDPMP